MMQSREMIHTQLNTEQRRQGMDVYCIYEYRLCFLARYISIVLWSDGLTLYKKLNIGGWLYEISVVRFLLWSKPRVYNQGWSACRSRSPPREVQGLLPGRIGILVAVLMPHRRVALRYLYLTALNQHLLTTHLCYPYFFVVPMIFLHHHYTFVSTFVEILNRLRSGLR